MAHTFSTAGSGVLGFERDSDLEITGRKDTNNGAASLKNLFATKASGSNISYIKLYDDRDPTFGTTSPDFVFPFPATGDMNVVFHVAYKFANGFSYCAAQEAGKTVTNNPDASLDTHLSRD